MVSSYGKSAMRARLSEAQNRRLVLVDGLYDALGEMAERNIREELEDIDTEIECLLEDVRCA
jgi:hypothetical protein